MSKLLQYFFFYRAPQSSRTCLNPPFRHHALFCPRVARLPLQDLPPPPTEEAWAPPEVDGETPAACRQTLVELFRVPLMTKVRCVPASCDGSAPLGEGVFQGA